MNRQELIDALAKKTGCTKADAKRYLLVLIAIITSALKKGDTVVLAGFGSFEVRRRAARVGRNPKTGAELKIKSSKVPAFKAGATLKATINKSNKIDTSAYISHFGYAGVTGARPKDRVHTEFALQRENTLEDAVDTSKEHPYKVVKVFFGTDRKPIPDAKSPCDYFKEDRGQAISYGTCEVSIPRDHVTGVLESPFMLKKYFENPEKHIVLMRINLREQSGFMDDLRAAAEKTNEALIFVHGFNNTFEDAARRTAQIAHDIEFTGVPMFYSWPSEGKPSKKAYIHDGNDATQAISYLKLFLKDIVENSKFSSVTLLAHSMGNRTLTEAFIDLKNDIGAANLRVFKEIILAAPDIDADTFKNQIAPALIASNSKVTLYASSTDEALIASKRVNGAPRAGDSGSGLVVLGGMETIDATNVDTNLFWGLRHAYVADERNVLSDLSYLIVKGLRASFRFGLAAIPSPGGSQYWKFKK